MGTTVDVLPNLYQGGVPLFTNSQGVDGTDSADTIASDSGFNTMDVLSLSNTAMYDAQKEQLEKQKENFETELAEVQKREAKTNEEKDNKSDEEDTINDKITDADYDINQIERKISEFRMQLTMGTSSTLN